MSINIYIFCLNYFGASKCYQIGFKLNFVHYPGIDRSEQGNIYNISMNSVVIIILFEHHTHVHDINIEILKIFQLQ